MILHDFKYLKIEVKDAPLKHLVTTWIGHSTKDEFLKGIDLILDGMVKNHVRHVLNDIREHKVIGVDSQNEAADKVKKFVMTHGLFKQAMLSPKDVFIKFGSKNFDKKIQDSVKDEINQFFDTEEQALKWLVSQKVS
jgi:hypothetical protein